jgi:hypothetical protein
MTTPLSMKPAHVGPGYFLALLVAPPILTHFFCAAHNNWLDYSQNRPQSLPWWSAWVFPAPVTLYIGAASLLIALVLLAIRHRRLQARNDDLVH